MAAEDLKAEDLNGWGWSRDERRCRLLKFPRGEAIEIDRRDQLTQNTKPNERATENDTENDKDDLTINTQDPPAGLPDIGAPGLGADEMPGGAITGGDGKAIRKEKKTDR
jgi:hypothetical protein